MSNFTDANVFANRSFCPGLFENLCWPQTPVGQSVNVSCAGLTQRGVRPFYHISRYCQPSGIWGNVSYNPCFYDDVVALTKKTYAQRSLQEKLAFLKLIKIVRYAEIAALSISLTSVLVSLLIFFIFKSLYCSRTKIHVNLLLAILVQTIARLATYIIQMAIKNVPPRTSCDTPSSLGADPNTSALNGICTLIIVLLQFGITAMFMWMLCEGIHLNSILTVSVFKNRLKTVYFHILGWVIPFCLTLSWSLVMFFKERHRRCFFNFNHLIYYWIIDGPRYAVMIINIILLLNILRVLMVKIKEGSEKQIREEKRRGSMNAKFVRKAVKAAIFLLPLLGITHMLETFVSADDKPIAIFAMYCCANVILKDLQGFYCSLLYCFLNAEVRETLRRRFQTTRIWYRWKEYLGDKDYHPNGTVNNESHSKIDLNSSNRVKQKHTAVKIEEHRLTADIDENNAE